VACVREPAFAEAVAAWRPRPGKVCLRARNASQWEQVLEEPHVLAGGVVAALPPRRRSERGPLLERLQAMSTDLETAPATAPAVPQALTYLLNPDAPMSSGKTLAQIAHAAVMAADTGRFEDWVAAGCPARVLAPSPDDFAAAAHRDDLAACVADAGLTEVAPGTVTVLALP
jgi:peptidyl-tRNA hydrolase